MKIEVCCNSINDCLTAKMCGADRIELTSASVLGGLTPSLGLLLEAKEKTRLPIMAMVRPRNGGCCYTEEKFSQMCRDAEIFVENGADGIVFGFLTENGFVDFDRTQEFLTHFKGVETVFHRAIDVAREPYAAIEKLISMGITRILTSGGKPSAPEGAAEIKALCEKFDNRIEILGGAGLNPSNVKKFVEETGLSQIHLGASMALTDTSADYNPQVDFGHMSEIKSNQYLTTDPQKLEKVIALVR